MSRAIAAAVALAMLALCGSAQAAGEVTLAPEGDEPQTVSLDAVPAALRVSDRPYTLRGGPQGDATVTVSGVTLDRLLDHAGIDPFDFEGIEIGAGGRTVALDREQATDVGAFPEGRPILWSDEQGTHFLRPSSGPGDLNADDLLTATDGSLQVTLRRGGDLTVEASASRVRVRKGQSVTFTATVGGPGSEAAPVRWSFDDGQRASGRRVTHRFARPGTYEVAVSAGANADEVGADDLLRIQVGKARTGGPDRKGGGTNGAADAPDSGAATGASGASSGTAPAPAPSTPSPPEAAPAPASAQPQPQPTTPELRTSRPTRLDGRRAGGGHPARRRLDRSDRGQGRGAQGGSHRDAEAAPGGRRVDPPTRLGNAGGADAAGTRRLARAAQRADPPVGLSSAPG